MNERKKILQMHEWYEKKAEDKNKPMTLENYHET